MSEWWTYRPLDFLMFSPRIYWRLFASLNEAWWPAQVLLVGAPAAWLMRSVGRTAASDTGLRAAAVFLALCWLLTAIAFLHQRFAPINWVASGYAVVFALQAFGLLALAAVGGVRSEASMPRRVVGVALGAGALLAYPLLALASGRPWQQAEVFGLAPDPTAIGTLAFLLLVSATAPAARWLLRLLGSIAVLWCVVSAATLATMGSYQAWLPVVGLLMAMLAARAAATVRSVH